MRPESKATLNNRQEKRPGMHGKTTMKRATETCGKLAKSTLLSGIDVSRGLGMLKVSFPELGGMGLWSELNGG